MGLILKTLTIAFLLSQNHDNKFKVVESGPRETLIEVNHSLTIGKEGDLKTAPFFKGVSRQHCKINLPLVGQFSVQDSGSKNGTYIKRGGKVIPVTSQEVAIDHGDIIVLGKPDNKNSLIMTVQ